MHVSWVCFAMILFAKSLFSTQILVYIVQLCIKPGGHTNKCVCHIPATRMVFFMHMQRYRQAPQPTEAHPGLSL